MNAVTTEIPALSHDAGVPPAPPEAHRQADDLRLIPLKRIVASPFNVRRKQPTGIEALADNIWHTGGLLQNLVVHPMKVGAKRAQTFGVAAGERRRRALALLAERGDLPADYPVRCLVITPEDAVLFSATENEMREPMHPADQFDAFRVQVDAGRTIAEIAQIYGVREMLVLQRLKLARISPKLVDLFREDQIRLDQMMALTLSDSHDQQESVWFEAKPYDRDANSIRRKLVSTERAFLHNRVALFVGTDAYEAAGGIVRRDLFSDQGAAWYSDQALMERVALQQLGVVAAEVLNEGWHWAEPVMNIDYNVRCAFAKMTPVQVPPTPEQQREFDTIDARIAHIEEEQGADDTDDDTYERLDAEANALAERRDEIEQSLYVYTPLQMSGGGVLVTIGEGGKIELLRGWVKRADAPAVIAGPDDDDDDDDGEGTQHAPAGRASSPPAPAQKPQHSAALTQRLNARRTAAVAVEIARQPHVALAALVHNFLAGDYGRGSGASALSIHLQHKSSAVERAASELAGDAAYQQHREDRAAWAPHLPDNADELLTWCVAQTDERLMVILAQYVAASVDGIAPSEGPHSINALINALGMKLSDSWQPTRAAYFDHVPKARIAEVVSSAVSPAEGMRLAKMKKADAAIEAERLMSATGWVPEHFAAGATHSAPLWGLRRNAPDDDADDDGIQPDADEPPVSEADAEDEATYATEIETAEAEGMPACA